MASSESSLLTTDTIELYSTDQEPNKPANITDIHQAYSYLHNTSISLESINSNVGRPQAKHCLSAESINSTLITEANSKLIQINELESNTDAEMELLAVSEDQSSKLTEPKLSAKSTCSSSKLSKLNRSISSSILSINKFKRKKVCRQSMQFNEQMNVCENVSNGAKANVQTAVHATRKSLTSKNLLKQIENLHEQAGKEI